MRHRYPVLSLGDFKALYADRHLYAFRRDLDQQSAVVIFNAGHEAAVHDLDLLSAQDEGHTFTDVWQTGAYTVQAGKLTGVHVPAREAVVLVAG